MTVCPVALAVGCKRCPIFSICPLKSVIGDYHPDGAEKNASDPGAAAKGKSSDKSNS